MNEACETAHLECAHVHAGQDINQITASLRLKITPQRKTDCGAKDCLFLCLTLHLISTH